MGMRGMVGMVRRVFPTPQLETIPSLLFELYFYLHVSSSKLLPPLKYTLVFLLEKV